MLTIAEIQILKIRIIQKVNKNMGLEVDQD